MHSKCTRYNCNFVQEVAHMDEALEVLRQHYRAIHPTKGFYQNREIENLEAYNLTVEELFEQNNAGPRDGDPQYDWRHLRSQVTRWRQEEQRGNAYIHPDTVNEVERRVEEHFAANPVQEAPPGAVRIQWVEDPVAQDVPVAAVVPPFGAQVEEEEGGF